MRMLWPEPGQELDDNGIDAAYAWPDGPWLRANMVATVDGAARAAAGLSGGISSGADKRIFGRLRGLADAVLVGAGTVRSEGYRPARAKPAFQQRRSAAGQRPAPVIVVVTRSLDLDPSLPLFTNPVERPIVFTCSAADSDRRTALAPHADVIDCGTDSVDLTTGVVVLREWGLQRILTEGGPHLLAQVAADGLLDELCLTVSPLLAGGDYVGGISAGRVLSGVPLPGSPRPMRLGHVLEDDGTLFLRYVLR